MPSVAERSLAVKADFPIFQRRFGGRELVYLDSAATSQKPEVVIEALAEHLRKHNANIHRGVYPLAQEADAAYDGARRRVAEFTGAEPETTIFTKNVTEAINLVAYAWGRANVHRGDAVLITQMEHHANIVPWQILCREREATLRYLEIDEHGEISLDALQAELARGDVALVAFAHVSNVLGTINPVAEMAARARAAGAGSLSGGAQAVPQMPGDGGAGHGARAGARARAHRVPARAPLAAQRRAPRGAARGRPPRRTGVVHGRGHAPPRRRGARGPQRRLHSRGPPLRAAADALPRGRRDGPGERGRVQPAGGHRRADRGAGGRTRDIRAVRWTTSTATTS